jgi:hypothetical protein
MIEGVELIIYAENGNQFGMDLSPTQLIAICKILGLELQNGEISCLSDESLKIIMEKTIDKLQWVNKNENY